MIVLINKEINQFITSYTGIETIKLTKYSWCVDLTSSHAWIREKYSHYLIPHHAPPRAEGYRSLVLGCDTP